MFKKIDKQAKNNSSWRTHWDIPSIPVRQYVHIYES